MSNKDVECASFPTFILSKFGFSHSFIFTTKTPNGGRPHRTTVNSNKNFLHIPIYLFIFVIIRITPHLFYRVLHVTNRSLSLFI